MKLIESRTSNLPMGFLVQIAQGHGVGEQLIESFRHFQTYRLFQFQRQSMADSAILLNFARPLVNVRLGVKSCSGFLRHGSLLFLRVQCVLCFWLTWMQFVGARYRLRSAISETRALSPGSMDVSERPKDSCFSTKYTPP